MNRRVIPYAEASRLLFNIPVVRLASRMSFLVQRDVLDPYGIKTAEWRILFNLVTTGDTHLRQIARHSGTDASYVSRILSRMEKAALVRRYADDNDARRTRFTVTEEGRRVFDEVYPKALAMSEEFRSRFNPEELEILQSVLDRAIAHANDMIDEGPDV